MYRRTISSGSDSSGISDSRGGGGPPPGRHSNGHIDDRRLSPHLPSRGGAGGGALGAPPRTSSYDRDSGPMGPPGGGGGGGRHNDDYYGRPRDSMRGGGDPRDPRMGPGGPGPGPGPGPGGPDRRRPMDDHYSPPDRGPPPLGRPGPGRPGDDQGYSPPDRGGRGGPMPPPPNRNQGLPPSPGGGRYSPPPDRGRGGPMPPPPNRNQGIPSSPGGDYSPPDRGRGGPMPPPNRNQGGPPLPGGGGGGRYSPLPDRGSGGPMPPPNRNQGPPNMPGGGGGRYSPAPDRGGRGGPLPPQHRNNEPPPSPGGEGGREIPGGSRGSRGSQNSETLNMAEQEFLSKYGYASNNSMGSMAGAPSVVGGQSISSADTGVSSISRPRMPRLGPGGGGGGPPPPNDRDPYHPRDHRSYMIGGGSGQSVTSNMSESMISNPRMSRMEIEEMERTQQSRGGGPPRSRSPMAPRNDNRRYQDRLQTYNNPNRPMTPSRDYPPDRGGGGGGYNPHRNNPYGDDQSYEEARGAPRGMDDPTPRRMMLQRVPSQSTISTSGFRSFYSDNWTVRDGSVSTWQSQHYYEGPPGPPPPPPRDGYNNSPPQQRYGGAGVNVNSRGGSPYGGGGYGDGPGGRGGPPGGGRGPPGGPPGGGYYGAGGPPPPHRPGYSPRGGPPPPGPPPHPHQRGPPGQPDRPLLEVAPGLMMHLMGTDETMKAIQRGQITVTSCVVCGMDVHCHSASEYVLCPDCRVVSPVNQLDNAGDMTPQQGGLVGLGVKTEMLITMMEAGGQQY